MTERAPTLLIALCLVLAPADGFLSLRAMLPSTNFAATTLSLRCQKNLDMAQNSLAAGATPQPAAAIAPSWAALRAGKGRALGRMVSRGMKIYGVGETEPAQDYSDIFEDREEIGRKACVEASVQGKLRLVDFGTFKDHVNRHFTEHLKCIALALHDPDEEPWSQVDGTPMVQHAEVIAVDSRGMDISVTVCDGTSCWLAVVHGRFPDRAAGVAQMFGQFDQLVDRCLCEHPMVDGLCKVPQEIIPETFLELAKVLNRNFLVQVNETVTALAGVDSSKGEYISRISVESIDTEGFTCRVFFCNVDSCTTMEVGVSFPRTAADAEDLQHGITACLEDGSCTVNGVSVLQGQGFEP